MMEIRVARHDRYIAIVSIDNGPRLNAMTRQMLSKLGALWGELERDPTCRRLHFDRRWSARLHGRRGHQRRPVGRPGNGTHGEPRLAEK